MSCFNNDGFAFEGLTKIVNGVGFVYFNLTSLLSLLIILMFLVLWIMIMFQ